MTTVSSTTTAAAAVRLSGVTKAFGAVQAVRGIDLELQQGEIVAFLGPNGAGKTTTIDMILGLSQPTTGTARILGLEPRGHRRRPGVGGHASCSSPTAPSATTSPRR